ncbi:MAG: hypothetical protein HW377_2612 [Actinobacteria bacterium]|nr:hypothetical protein [Actinomycetota bacterium]
MSRKVFPGIPPAFHRYIGSNGPEIQQIMRLPQVIRITMLEYFGGAERDRTVGLLNAIQALSQLSYSPTLFKIMNLPQPPRKINLRGFSCRGFSHVYFFDRR